LTAPASGAREGWLAVAAEPFTDGDVTPSPFGYGALTAKSSKLTVSGAFVAPAPNTARRPMAPALWTAAEDSVAVKASTWLGGAVEPRCDADRRRTGTGYLRTDPHP
jgi:hypothetical protein